MSIPNTFTSLHVLLGKLALLIAIALPNTSTADPFGPTTADLYESCSQAGAQEAYCIGYLKAHRDWYQSMGSWVQQAISNEFHYCEPKEINYLMMKDAFLRYVQSHPEIRTAPRLEGVAHALHDTWPCPNENTRTIQLLLSELGYDVGEVDGFLNSKTKQAIHRYQVDNHMSAKEISNKILLDSLGKKIRAARQTKDIDKQ